jgi:hypothetical protein
VTIVFGPRSRALVLGLQVIWALGCGEPMLPSDYAGPPAETVVGNVLGEQPELRNAKQPAFSLEWLTEAAPVSVPLQSTALHGQPLQFQRSPRNHDWSIGVERPSPQARLDLSYASDHVRFAVGKMVYFDDGVPNGRLDWRCVGSQCDVIKAVSAEFIVFVERPPTCRPASGGPLRDRLSPGFHYYRLDPLGLREVSPGEPLSFVPTVRSLAESVPTENLRDFAVVLIERWRGSAFDGC